MYNFNKKYSLKELFQGGGSVTGINQIQKLNFELMKLASFNEFDGDKVVAGLISNKELWRGAVMDREGYSFESARSTIDLIKLRDIEEGHWSVDTLFILSSNKDNAKLEKLARSWEADEVDWMDKEEAERSLGSSQGGSILRVWWD